MAWLDRLFGTSGSYRYNEGDQYPDYTNMPQRPESQGWSGPNIFQDPGRGEGSSYYYPQDQRTSSYPSGYEVDRRPPPGNTNDRPIYNNERVSHAGDPFSAEATDRAIALALAEEEKRRDPPPSDTSADEELARALQESLDLEDSGPQRGGGAISRPPLLRPSVTGGCAGCKQTLGFGRFLSCLGKNWHPDCFVCKLCSKPIADREFSVQGGDAYHRECYKELFHPKCEVCTQFIPTNAAGLIEYRSHPFWNQKYCPRHERDGTPRCCSCDRIQTAEVQYPALEDGRKLCLECLETAVVDTKECQPLYRDILKFYKQVGMMIDQEVPMLLVARDALNEAQKGEKEGMHTSETRGLCLSEEQTITTVFGGKNKHASRLPSIWTEPQKLVRHCEVTAILVLYGLPRLLTGSILAHELMHAWLRLAGGFPHMRPEVEEGICQVMSHIWLSTELRKFEGKGASSSSQKGVNTSAQARLGQFYLHQIATDSSPIYGDGFRRGVAAVNQFGLSRVLQHLRLTANFP